MKSIFKKTAKKYLHKNKLKITRKVFDKQIDGRLSNIKNIVHDEAQEKAFINKWQVLDAKVSSKYYRVYRTLSKVDSLDFVPDYLYYTTIEPILNNYKLRQYGEEKNYYDKLFNDLKLPLTVLRNINGIYLDEAYNELNLTDETLLAKCTPFNAIFIKPTIETGQGKNVSKFTKINNTFISDKGAELSVDFLHKQYMQDFIIQEYLPQAELLNMFNKDSINTLRILTYRSVKDNTVHLLHSTLRVGKNGSLIDASRAGGRFCGIDKDGNLIKQVYDSKGNLYDDFNGIDIKNQNYKIPNYDQVVQLALHAAKQVHHHRVLALDIMINDKNEPRVIEINPSGQGMFIFQATIGPMFGDFTDEVIEFCQQNQEKFLSNYTLEL